MSDDLIEERKDLQEAPDQRSGRPKCAGLRQVLRRHRRQLAQTAPKAPAAKKAPGATWAPVPAKEFVAAATGKRIHILVPQPNMRGKAAFGIPVKQGAHAGRYDLWRVGLIAAIPKADDGKVLDQK